MPPSAAAGGERATTVLWSLAVRNATPHDASTSLVPGIAEGIAHLHAPRGRQACRCATTGTTPRACSRRVKQQTQRAACDGSLDVTLTGVARSFVVHARQARGGESQLRAGSAIAERMRAAHEAAREARARARLERLRDGSGHVGEPRSASRPSRTPRPPTTWRSRSRPTSSRACSSSPRATAATRAGTCAAWLTPTEMAEAACEEHDRPQTLLPIVDCKVELLDDPDAPLHAAAAPPRRRAATVAITLTVCGDAPVRLPELLDLFAREAALPMTQCSAPLRSSRSSAAARRARASSTTSPTPSRRGTSTRASPRPSASSWATSTCASSCTIFQVYRVGTSNVPRSFETTPWCGTYGAAVNATS